MKRDVVIRAGGHVRLARLLAGPEADTVWTKLPIYGTTGRTSQGLLAFAGACDMPVSSEAVGLADAHHYLSYCLRARQIVLPSSRFAGATDAFVRLAKLEVPFADAVLEAIASGVRISLMHADS